MSAFCAWKGLCGTTFYRSVLRDYGRVNQPKLILRRQHQAESPPDAGVGCTGINRLEAVTKRLDPKTVEALLTKLKPLLSARFRTSGRCNTLCTVSKNSPVPINRTQPNCYHHEFEGAQIPVFSAL